MMIFTHILIGVLLATGAAQLSTLPTSYFLILGALGGILPDVDMLFIHRKTLHYPVMFSALTIVLILVYPFIQSELLLMLIAVTSAAAVHCLMDTLGGGKEMRPWLEADERAVYNHFHQRWIEPLRIFYDGSLPDLLISVGSAVAILSVVSAEFNLWIIALVVLAVIYTLFRRIVTRWIPAEYKTFSSYIQDKIS